MKLRVLYDISELGSYTLTGERGVRRVVENIAKGLMAEPTIDLSFTGISEYDRPKVARILGDGFAGRTYFSPTPRALDALASVSMRMRHSAIGQRLRPRRIFHAAFSLLPRLTGEMSRKVSASVLARAQVFHSPFAPLPPSSCARSKLAWFLTMYDLIPLIYPHLVAPVSIRDVSAIARSLHPEAWVTCISESVKIDICERLGFPAERIFVTPLAASTSIFHPAFDAEAEATRQRYGLRDSPYILSLSELEPRKNLEHVIESFARLSDEAGTRDVKLVLVGRYSPGSAEVAGVRRKHAALHERIIFTGFVPNEHLAAIYSGAIAFAYPSLAEGFGLPPLEAMQCGAPVICSDRTSLPEVVGDAGFLLDPADVDAWADAMLRLINDATLREQMRARSLARAKLFTWEKTLRELVSAYLYATGNC